MAALFGYSRDLAQLRRLREEHRTKAREIASLLRVKRWGEASDLTPAYMLHQMAGLGNSTPAYGHLLAGQDRSEGGTMEKLFEPQPRMVRRRRGGWLALSPAGDSLKIGVVAPTEEQARERFEIATAAWRRTLATAGEHQIAG